MESTTIAAVDAVEVEVRRSARRRQTVSAYREGERVVVLVPDALSDEEEHAWVETMVARVEADERSRRDDEELLERARVLSDTYLGGLAAPVSVRWVSNQTSRWGSCTPGDRTIRLSERLQAMPSWVVDYVIVHELAHLLEPGHDDNFWGWVNGYPHTERAKGYLLGWSDAGAVAEPPGQESEVD
ncbi:M48 metallopeptidase family protein [Nocardioides bruguierae]|uniref:M48 family metallopeptidase n=1 Tax=Nocardioides bruguierae TaxID=2945102 RepID=A0A9X2D533_9ACTN|nr:M48 family metallopeptidase [Nocardioides bruguierae]MCL8024903.1 M48 family metallopeptidase [Nocardioides bruguierae]MCM0619306.1 M48 family metallopeptidase [Nocardioides bruguierae]